MIKKLTIADKDEILRITKDIWEGEDYIPFLIDKWFLDENAVIAGYFEDDKLIGFGRMSQIVPGHVWMEGLRKDPSYEGKGLTYKLSGFFFEELKKIKEIKSIRFCTYFDNQSSIKANEHLGFTLEKRFSFKEYSIKHRKRKFPDQIKRNNDIDSAFSLIASSRYLNDTSNNVIKGWKVAATDKTWIETILNEGIFFEYRDQDILKGFALVWKTDYEPAIWISVIEYDSYAVFRELMVAIESYGQKMRVSKIQAALPPGKYREDFNRIGFFSWECEDDFLLYSLPTELLQKLKK